MGKIRVPSTIVKPKRVQKEKKTETSKAVIRVPDISDALIKGKPYWEKLLLNLGYRKDQAEKFAEIYTFYMVEMSKLVKKHVATMVRHMLGMGQDIALAIGWIGADINRNDFYKRMESKKASKKQKDNKKPAKPTIKTNKAKNS